MSLWLVQTNLDFLFYSRLERNRIFGIVCQLLFQIRSINDHAFWSLVGSHDVAPSEPGFQLFSAILGSDRQFLLAGFADVVAATALLQMPVSKVVAATESEPEDYDPARRSTQFFLTTGLGEG